MQTHLKKLWTIGTIGLLTGCANQVTVINSDADLVRLGSDVTGHVYLRDAKGNWNLSRNKVTLPEGWYAGPYHPK